MLSVRPATIADVGLLRALIRELAEFEHELDYCVIEEADLARDGFGPNPKFRALIAEWDGKAAGYAVFFGYYSTVFVRSPFRGKGIGTALLAAVAQIALRENSCAMRWEVLDWNERAIDLYKTLGAEFPTRWRSVLLTGDALRRLAERAQ
jgi:GNAT superfamily N-acetyltransferase